ncbi:EthD family reductase [Streptomyces sp. W16]|uniref:EthD family reductase n=1 Tax=Streptomyces sp. W16 TaxID=3076631 RepID=UPI00295B48F7|nr:EthD family reductase [Streptomyces sp. W16]MDV9172496.1 EthD family reductase [Streptomyces sp. W16]
MNRIVVEYFDPADPDAFDTRYRDEHVALVRAIPGLVDFHLSHPRGLRGVTPYLVAEMSFADEDSVATALKSAEFAEAGKHAAGFVVASTALYTSAPRQA